MGEINFQFVQQPTPRTCVHACLSMVTGIPVQELIVRFGDTGLAFECEAAVLVENRIWPEQRFHDISYYPDGFYMASAPSLNCPGGLHRVVVESRDGDFIVHDPNTGREGVKAYPPNALHGGEPGMSMLQPAHLNTEMLRHMKK